MALLRLCAVPDCDDTTDGNRCAKHTRVRDRRRGTSADRGYDAEWRRVRLHVLARDDYRCQLRLPGCTGVADTVDHRIPLSAGGARLDPGNLQSACRRCNTAKGGRNHHRPSWAT